MLSPECSLRGGILTDTSPIGLISIRQSILRLIQKHLFPNADQVNPPTTVILQITNPRMTRYVCPAEESVFEIDNMDLFRHIGFLGLRGCYLPSEGKTYLVKGKWCLETLIHETLHSCSINSQKTDLKRYDQLFDGLTEFYTGYILFQEFKDCYSKCFLPEGKLCEMTYNDYTKMWATMCHFISLRNTIGIYFPTNNPWEDEVDIFVKKIKDLGFQKFRNPFIGVGLSSVNRLEMICFDCFGDKFAKISSQKERFIDFSDIIDT